MSSSGSSHQHSPPPERQQGLNTCDQPHFGFSGPLPAFTISGARAGRLATTLPERSVARRVSPPAQVAALKRSKWTAIAKILPWRRALWQWARGHRCLL